MSVQTTKLFIHKKKKNYKVIWQYKIMKIIIHKLSQIMVLKSNFVLGKQWVPSHMS